MRMLNPGFAEKKDFEVFRRLEEYALKLLESALQHSEKPLFYHSIDHTKSVLKYALKFGKDEGLASRELLLVGAAALFHDTGYGKEYANNEYWGGKKAELALPKFGFSTEEIRRIRDTIMATQLHADMKSRPRNKLEKVICDADLANVGFWTKDYLELSEELRKEFGIDDEIHWIKTQLKFFEAHTFHTSAAQRWGASQKMRNRKYLEKRLHKLEKMRMNHAIDSVGKKKGK
ncbi:HD domain-containing protein [Candidatus Woesearchaeota archaeon]|nr:HD domain-containing protein [Candidatus Woesearchaeota archaeon]